MKVRPSVKRICDKCKVIKRRGVLLAVCSKNDPQVARAGFSHPDSVLKVEDFASFQASWEPKPQGLIAIARELNLGLDSLVFVDDNPFERELVARTLPEVCVAKVSDVARYAGRSVLRTGAGKT